MIEMGFMERKRWEKSFSKFTRRGGGKDVPEPCYCQVVLWVGLIINGDIIKIGRQVLLSVKRLENRIVDFANSGFCYHSSEGGTSQAGCMHTKYYVDILLLFLVCFLRL